MQDSFHNEERQGFRTNAPGKRSATLLRILQIKRAELEGVLSSRSREDSKECFMEIFEKSEFEPVSEEFERSYYFGNATVSIIGVVAQSTNDCEFHFLITEAGEKFVVKPDWLAMSVRGKEWPI
jgi:hypothetical protein